MNAPRHKAYKFRALGLSIFLPFIVSVFLAAPHPDPSTDQSRHPSYQVQGRVTQPRVFAEGTISTADDEIGGAFSADGSEFYFSRLVPYTTLPRLGIMCVSYFRGGHWSMPEVLPFSGKY